MAKSRKLKTADWDAMTRLRSICLGLPDAVEEIKWGEPHFCVVDKIFAGCGGDEKRPVIGFKMQKVDARQLVRLPGCKPAPYVGRHGWVSLDTAVFDDWEQISEFIVNSYRLIAPKRLLARLPSSP